MTEKNRCTLVCDGCGKTQTHEYTLGAADHVPPTWTQLQRVRLTVEVNHQTNTRNAILDVCDDKCARVALAKYIETWPPMLCDPEKKKA